MSGRQAVLSRRERLLFEAGIKLGGVFHQYLGTPVSPRTAPSLSKAIQEAVTLQPFVRRVKVRIDPRRGGPVGPGRYGYRYLTAEMMKVEVELTDGEARVVAGFAFRPDLRYPLMEVRSAHPSGAAGPRRARTR